MKKIQNEKDKMVFNGRKIKDITGMRSGKLVAQRPVDPKERYGDRNKKVILWECLCDCGNTTIVRASRITLNEYQSCGCIRTGGHAQKRGYRIREKATYDYPFSKEDFKNSSIPMWYIKRTYRCAVQRGREFNLDIQYLNDIFDGTCKLSGRIIGFYKSSSNLTLTTASLDRIDSTKDYINENVQWVHKEVNMLKQRHENDDFIVFCIRHSQVISDVSEHNKKLTSK